MSGDHNKTHKKTKTEEDFRLKNWSLWLEEWKKVGGNLSKRVNVPLDTLLMNYGEDARKVNEEKLMLEYAKIPTEFDRYRGKPDFWKLPVSLPKRFQECKNEPTYFTVQTKEEKYVVPSIEYIGAPDYINQNEKNILTSSRNIYKRWQNSEYRREQLEKLTTKIEEIVPHKPSLENLIVLGKSLFPAKTEAKEETAEGSVQEDAAEEEGEKEQEEKSSKSVTSSSSGKKQRLSVLINDIPLELNSCELSGCRKLRINFEYDVIQKEPQKKVLQIDNNGLVALRMSWKRVNRFRFFRDFPTINQNLSHFYFNKNDLIVLPDQSIQIPIWFKSETSGTYSEDWELDIKPRLWSEDFHFILVLHSYAYFGDMKEKVDYIVKYIRRKAKENLIKEILADVIDKVKYKEIQVVPLVYEESQLFEIANFMNGRPLYLFDELIVNELKSFYEKMKSDDQNWNYSIKDLIKLAQTKDVEMYLENKESEITEKISTIEEEEAEKRLEMEQKSGKEEKVKDKSKTKKKNKKSGDKKSKEKSSGKSSKKSEKSKGKSLKKSKKSKESEEEPISPPEEVKKENYVYSNQLELWKIVKKLDSPIIINKEREKMFSCSKVMSTYFSKMCHLLEMLEREYDIIHNYKYPEVKHKLVPTNDLPDRLIYEYFESDYLSNKPPYVSRGGAKRKPKILTNIPSDDVETIYSTYFHIDLGKKEVEGKRGKRKKSNSKSPKKDRSKSPKKGKKKEGKSSKKGRSKSSEKKETDVEPSIESFDPYAEEFRFVPKEEEVGSVSLVEDDIERSKEAMGDYKYRQYVTVYICLGEAVGAIIDTIDSFDRVVPHSTLNELKNIFPNSFEVTDKKEG